MSSDDVRGPFAPGFGLAPPYLAGRSRLVHEMAAGLADGPGPDFHSLVIGPRGAGKTVLVNNVAGHAAAELRAIVVRWTAGDADRPLGLALRESLVAAVRDHGDKGRGDRFRGEVGVEFGVPGVGVAKASAGVDPRGPLAPESVVGLMRSFGEFAAQRRRMVLMVVDEIQAATPSDLASLGTAIQEVANVEQRPVALLAAGLPTTHRRFAEIATTRKSVAFLERLDWVEIGNLDRSDTLEAFVVPFEEAGWEITDEALDMVVEGSRGYPYAVQLIGAAAWKAADGSGVVDSAEATRGVRFAYQRMERTLYRERWTRMSGADRKFVRIAASMHHAGGPIEPGAISEQMYGNRTSASSIRDRLISEHHLLMPAGRGRVQFAIPGFAEWVRRSEGEGGDSMGPDNSWGHEL